MIRYLLVAVLLAVTIPSHAAVDPSKVAKLEVVDIKKPVKKAKKKVKKAKRAGKAKPTAVAP